MRVDRYLLPFIYQQINEANISIFCQNLANKIAKKKMIDKIYDQNIKIDKKVFKKLEQQYSAKTKQLKSFDIQKAVGKLISQHNDDLQKNKIQTYKFPSTLKYHIQDVSQFSDVMIYYVRWSYFGFHISVLNVDDNCIQAEDLYQVGKGAFGNIFKVNYRQQFYLMKRIYMKNNAIFGILDELQSYSQRKQILRKYSKEYNKVLSQTLKQYCIAKLCSIFKVGPLINNFESFDLVCYHNCIEFVMENCSQQFPQIENQELQSQLERNLSILHTFGIVHLDIKFDHIKYSKAFSKIVLIDYGLSTYISQNFNQKTMVYGFKGTLQYAGAQMKQLLTQQKSLVNLYQNDRICLQKTLKQIYIRKETSGASSNKSHGSGSRTQEKESRRIVTMNYLTKLYRMFMNKQYNLTETQTLNLQIEQVSLIGKIVDKYTKFTCMGMAKQMSQTEIEDFSSLPNTNHLIKSFMKNVRHSKIFQNCLVWLPLALLQLEYQNKNITQVRNIQNIIFQILKIQPKAKQEMLMLYPYDSYLKLILYWNKFLKVIKELQQSNRHEQKTQELQQQVFRSFIIILSFANSLKKQILAFFFKIFLLSEKAIKQNTNSLYQNLFDQLFRILRSQISLNNKLLTVIITCLKFYATIEIKSLTVLQILFDLQMSILQGITFSKSIFQKQYYLLVNKYDQFKKMQQFCNAYFIVKKTKKNSKSGNYLASLIHEAIHLEQMPAILFSNLISMKKMIQFQEKPHTTSHQKQYQISMQREKKIMNELNFYNYRVDIHAPRSGQSCIKNNCSSTHVKQYKNINTYSVTRKLDFQYKKVLFRKQKYRLYASSLSQQKKLNIFAQQSSYFGIVSKQIAALYQFSNKISHRNSFKCESNDRKRLLLQLEQNFGQYYRILCKIQLQTRRNINQLKQYFSETNIFNQKYHSVVFNALFFGYNAIFIRPLLNPRRFIFKRQLLTSQQKLYLQNLHNSVSKIFQIHALLHQDCPSSEECNLIFGSNSSAYVKCIPQIIIFTQFSGLYCRETEQKLLRVLQRWLKINLNDQFYRSCYSLVVQNNLSRQLKVKNENQKKIKVMQNQQKGLACATEKFNNLIRDQMPGNAQVFNFCIQFKRQLLNKDAILGKSVEIDQQSIQGYYFWSMLKPENQILRPLYNDDAYSIIEKIAYSPNFLDIVLETYIQFNKKSSSSLQNFNYFGFLRQLMLVLYRIRQSPLVKPYSIDVLLLYFEYLFQSTHKSYDCLYFYLEKLSITQKNHKSKAILKIYPQIQDLLRRPFLFRYCKLMSECLWQDQIIPILIVETRKMYKNATVLNPLFFKEIKNLRKRTKKYLKGKSVLMKKKQILNDNRIIFKNEKIYLEEIYKNTQNTITGKQKHMLKGFLKHLERGIRNCQKPKRRQFKQMISDVYEYQKMKKPESRRYSSPEMMRQTNIIQSRISGSENSNKNRHINLNRLKQSKRQNLKIDSQ